MKLTYEEFCEKILEYLRENKDWVILTDWISEEEEETRHDRGQSAAANLAASENLIEMEMEKGPFYEYLTISADVLYEMYGRDGWAAVTGAIDRRTRGQGRALRRAQAEDYTKWLDDDGRALYGELREIRASFAAQKQLPPYFICVNRALYEMCREQPLTKEDLKSVYGIGEKSAEAYGDAFISKIREFTGGHKRTMVLEYAAAKA